MPLKRIDQGGQKRDQAFGADVPGGLPGQQQGLLDLRTVMGRTGAQDLVLALWRMIQEANSAFASVASERDELIEQQALVGQRSLLIARSDVPEQLTPGLGTQSQSLA